MENISIRECGFSTRLENVLWNANYKTTDDLLKMPIEKFLADMKYWPNFGKKSALEFKHWLYSIKAFNCSNFKQELEQLAELYELQEKVKNLITEKQKQLDFLLHNIDPAVYCYAEASLSSVQKGNQHDANSLASR